jgi:hypothetical protein
MLINCRLIPGANDYIKKEQAKVRWFPLLVHVYSLLTGSNFTYHVCFFITACVYASIMLSPALVVLHDQNRAKDNQNHLLCAESQ